MDKAEEGSQLWPRMCVPAVRCRIMSDDRSEFPLYERAQRAGVLEAGNAVIVAPTATGKSYIGRAILRGAVGRGMRGE